MLFQCRQPLIWLAWLLPALVVVVALDLNEIDKSLNPRLVGMIFNLYKPTISTKRPPIVVDCDHPGILCQFGTKPLVARPISECKCKDEVVPIVTGLQPEPDKETNGEQAANEGGEAVSPKTPGTNTDVPIYKGIMSNMEAVLESGAVATSLQYKPSEKLPSDRWSPSSPDDLYQKRFGELPKKYASYYPFSKPTLIDDPDEFDPADFDQGPPFPFFPEMFGPHHKHHQFHPFKNKQQNGQASKPQTNWRQTAKPTSVTTTKKSVKVDSTTPVLPSKPSDKDSAKKT